MSRILRSLSLCLVLAFLAPDLWAEDSEDYELTPEEQAYMDGLRATLESLDPQTGDIPLAGGIVTLHVPDDYYYLSPADSRRVLEDLWGNPPGNEVLGMLFPARYAPLDDEAWAVTIEYYEDGHISDEDAAHIDYDDLLVSMQQDTADYNAERQAAGYEPVHLLGWAEPPYYDQATRKLYWAKELRFGDSEETTLNYDIRALGRVGVLDMTFVASTWQLAEINDSRDAVLGMADFNEGHRYADFDASVDEVAAYGIGALIAGKVAAKAGLFAAALVLLKKFGVVILLGLAAAVRWLRSLFGASKAGEA